MQKQNINVKFEPIIFNEAYPIIDRAHTVSINLLKLIESSTKDDFYQVPLEAHNSTMIHLQLQTSKISFEEQSKISKDWVIDSWSKDLTRGLELALLCAHETLETSKNIQDLISDDRKYTISQKVEILENIVKKNRNNRLNTTDNGKTKPLIKDICKEMKMDNSFQELLIDIVTLRNILSHSDNIVKEKHCQKNDKFFMKLLSSKILINNIGIPYQNFYELSFQGNKKLSLTLEQVFDMNTTSLWIIGQLQYSVGKHLEKKFI